MAVGLFSSKICSNGLVGPSSTLESILTFLQGQITVTDCEIGIETFLIQRIENLNAFQYQSHKKYIFGMKLCRIAQDLIVPVFNRTVMSFLNQLLTILLTYCRVKHVEFFF